MYDQVIDFIRDIYDEKGYIPLHAPKFIGNEKKYLSDCIDSTFVSSSGRFIDDFEERLAHFTGAKYVVATSNGTAALHISLLLAGVSLNDEVITQPLTFIASCNAINYCGAKPLFIDVDRDTMGLSPEALSSFLSANTKVIGKQCINKLTGRVIKACVPMHTFGHPCRIDEIKEICDSNNIKLVEDSAESLGSFFKGRHTGTFGQLGVISFNGNKIITGGAGGCILTDDKDLFKKARHLTTTAKIPHKWEYNHDEIGYNYRLPNIIAALLMAQLENLDAFLINKKKLTENYKDFFSSKKDIEFVLGIEDSSSNNWLNSIILKDLSQRDIFLEETNHNGIMTRPIWTLMNKIDMFKDCYCDSIENSLWLNDRVVNIPSSVIV
jgi:perosamine synthetase